jgi:aryl-alcohol dehydrogenase-like predicted oxidoreductase
MIPWSPLAGGLLGGALQKAAEGRRSDERAQRRIDALRLELEQWEKLCAELGHAPADVALAWLLQQPVVTGPIIGPRTIEQLEASMVALDVTLDAQTLHRIDAIFPGPGGPAPEAYAW